MMPAVSDLSIISFFIWEVPIFVSLFVSVKLNSAFIVDGSIRCLPAS